MSEQITREQFADTSGQNYRLKAETPVDVKLVEVTQSKDCGGGFESFSLFFVGDEDAVVPQNTYEVQNDTLGETKIFVSPVQYPQAEKGQVYYQAVFSYKKN
jgi:DUF1365 family protein